MSRTLDILKLAEMSRQDLVLLALDQERALERLRRKSRAHRKQLREMQRALERKNLIVKRYTDQPIIIYPAYSPPPVMPAPAPTPWGGYEITCEGNGENGSSSARPSKVTHTGRVR